LEKSKTKEISEILKKLPGKGQRDKSLLSSRSTAVGLGEKSSLITELPKEAKVKKRTKSFLIVLPGMDKNIILAVRNIPGVKVVQAKDLNVLNLLSFKYLIMPEEAIKVVKETFLK
jgi:large subunit ribosomal protein L4